MTQTDRRRYRKPHSAIAWLSLPLAFVVACSGSVPADGADGIGEGVSPSGNPGPSLGEPSDGVSGGPQPSAAPAGGSGGPTAGASAGPSAPGSPPADASNPGGVVEFVEPEPGAVELPARTWRLTHEQYRRSVLDLVGLEPDLSAFVPETAGTFFDNFSSTGFVRVDLANNYFDAAKAIAGALSESQLGALTSCDLGAACIDAFIEQLASKAFRRPASAQEVAAYREVYDVAADSEDTTAGFRTVVRGLLNSPLFLYRTEIGAEASEASARFELTNYEVASLLSYSLLDGPPTSELLAAAQQGLLTQPERLAEQVRGLLDDPRAQQQLSNFLTQWLEIQHFSDVEKFADVFPGFDAVKPQMAEEAQAFFAQSGGPDNSFAELLLDPVPAVDPALDAFYRSDPSAPGSPERIGILGLGSVLSTHAKAYLTSPTLRGTFVRRRLFCQEITLPPGFTPPPLSDTEVLGVAKTTRDLYERHQTDPSCSVCHRLTDNIGFSLEEFDGAGRFRTLDTTQGLAELIDSAAMLTDTDVDRPIDDHVDLAGALSESELVRQCLAVQAFRFYFGQHESSTGQPPIVDGHRALRQDGTLGDLLVGALSTPSTFSRVRE